MTRLTSVSTKPLANDWPDRSLQGGGPPAPDNPRLTLGIRLRMAVRLAQGVLAVMLGVLLCAGVFPLVSHRRRYSLIRGWARLFVWSLGIRVAVQGAWPATPGRYLLASNHISWLDIFVIHSVHPVRFVSKSEVRQWPVAGFLAQQAGTLFLDRNRKRDTKDIGQEMLAALEMGDAIGIFPEGTTSNGTVLLPFFSPLLQPAVACMAAVVPTGLRYEDPRTGERNLDMPFVGQQNFLQSVLITLRQPGLRAIVRFDAPIQSDGQHRRVLTQQVEQAVSRLLAVPIALSGREGGGQQPGSRPVNPPGGPEP